MQYAPGMSGNIFFAFWDGNGKTKKVFPVLRTATGITKNIPVVWDGNGKYKKTFLLFWTGTGKHKFLSLKRDGNGKFESALKYIFFFFSKYSFHYN